MECDRSDEPNSSSKPPQTLDVSKDILPIYSAHSALSPETPSSVFGKTRLPENKKCVVIAVVLCYWDNILGPRIRHLWHVQSLSHLIAMDVLNYISNHTLSGEICRDPGNSQIDSTFYVLKDKRLLVTAFIFCALGKADFGVHSLSVIVAHKDLHLYLNWQTLTMSWMQRGVAKLRIVLEKFQEDQAIMKFTAFLSEFLSMLNSIRDAPVSHNISLIDTAFHPQHKFNKSFVHKAIQSHLTTCGRSVIIGKAPGKINMMIATLSMFLRPRERSCCRYVSADQPWAYHPDLCVQGLLVVDGEELGKSLKNIYLSQYPTTLVDLIGNEVKLSALPHEHRPLRHDALVQDLQALWKDNDLAGYPTSDMFHTTDDPDTLVSIFVDWMHQLPASGGHREALVHKFMHMLEKRAFTLIKYVETHSRRGSNSLQEHVKKLKQDLSLTVSGDFNVVMATAERLKPDIYSIVYGEQMTNRGKEPASNDMFV